MEDTATQARFSEATYRMLEKGNADERIGRINVSTKLKNLKVKDIQ